MTAQDVLWLMRKIAALARAAIAMAMAMAMASAHACATDDRIS